MTAAILRGTLAQVIQALMQAPKGMTVKEWISITRRDSGKKGGNS